MNESKKNPDVTLLQGIYNTVSMGSDSVLTILGKTKEEGLRQELTEELEGYQKFGSIVRDRLSSYSSPAEEPGLMQKLPAELSIRMSTLADDSSSKLAELMMNGATMGIVELKKEVKSAEKAGVQKDHLELAEGVLTFQQRNIDKMKEFL